MNKNAFIQQLTQIPESEPDAIDKQMMEAGAAVNDDTSLPLDTVRNEIEGYSGRVLVRIPKSLHRQLVQDAKREGISLNQYALYKLSRNG